MACLSTDVYLRVVFNQSNVKTKGGQSVGHGAAENAFSDGKLTCRRPVKAVVREFRYPACISYRAWGMNFTSILYPAALAYASMVERLGDTFEWTFSKREMLLFLVWSFSAIAS